MDVRIEPLQRYRGLVLAFAISAAAIAIQWHVGREDRLQYHRSSLPGFDSWVYVAMADYPSFFTLPPWGYRVLTPWVVHHLPLRRPRGFRTVTVATLVMAGFLLFPFLRRLGGGEAACLLAVAAFGLSPPVRECLDNYFVPEAMTVFLIVAFLLAVEAGCSVAVLSLLAVLGVLSKEILLPLLPVVWLARRDRKGDRRALLEMGLVACPVILISVTLRLWWTPYIEPPLPQLSADYFSKVLDYVGRTWRVWLRAALVGGLMPLAVLGAFGRGARSFLRRYGYVLGLSLLLPFLNPLRLPFSLNYLAKDYSRYLIYAMPCILPLCLVALNRFWPHFKYSPVPQPSRRFSDILAVCGVALLLLTPLVATDRYRRAQPGERHGYFVRVFVRQSLRTAERLEAGQAIEWDLKVDVPPEGSSFPSPPRAIRWFLGEGWGTSRDTYGEQVEMAADEARFLLPSFVARDVDIILSMDSPDNAAIHLRVNGVDAGWTFVGRERADYTFRAPSEALFRGDNIVTLLQGRGESATVRLHRITLRPLRMSLVSSPALTFPSRCSPARSPSSIRSNEIAQRMEFRAGPRQRGTGEVGLPGRSGIRRNSRSLLS